MHGWCFGWRRAVGRMAALLATFGFSPLQAHAGEIRLGLVPENVFTSPAYAAEKLGLFKAAGIDV